MRRLMAMTVIGALAGCAQVTRFNEPDGSSVYLVDCDGMSLLESCQTAMARTCPDGYRVLRAPVAGPHDDRPVRDAGMFRCTGNPD